MSTWQIVLDRELLNWPWQWEILFDFTVELSREVSQLSPEVVVGRGSTPTRENTSKGSCCWSILRVHNLTKAMSRALYMDPPDDMQLEPAPCSLSGAIPEASDPLMTAAVEGTACVQSCSVSRSCLR